MALYNIEMQRFNGTSYDKTYPIPYIEMDDMILNIKNTEINTFILPDNIYNYIFSMFFITVLSHSEINFHIKFYYESGEPQSEFDFNLPERDKAIIFPWFVFNGLFYDSMKCNYFYSKNLYECDFLSSLVLIGGKYIDIQAESNGTVSLQAHFLHSVATWNT